MKRNTFTLAVALLLVAALAAPALATRLSGADHGGAPLTATLTGAAERPGPGDEEGTGTALITLNAGQEEVCWELTFEDIAEPTAAHIHKAPASDPGPVVVTLNALDPGCTTADSDLIRALQRDPSAYYVNIHNHPFPGGAIRGQLGRK